jgi:hypothetical protein
MINLIVTIPTLGHRPDFLLLTLDSLESLPKETRIEVSTPNLNLVKQALEGTKHESIVVFHDQADQANSILNSWERNPSTWYTWINDDDICGEFSKEDFDFLANNYEDFPQVFYGNLGILKNEKAYTVRTPRHLTHNILRYGGNYVPGVMTFLNQKSVNVLLHEKQNSATMRDAFDYQWWLELSKVRAQFRHTNSILGYWRDHPLARTQNEASVVKKEREFLLQKYCGYKYFYKSYRVKKMFFKIVARTLRFP